MAREEPRLLDPPERFQTLSESSSRFEHERGIVGATTRCAHESYNGHN